MALTQYAHGAEAGEDVSMTPKEALCDSLYTLGETLAQLATSNRGVCESLIDEREKIKCHMAAKGVSMGLSLYAGCSTFSTIQVAQTVAATSLAPEALASAGLAGYTGDVILTTTILCFNPFVLAAATGLTAVLAYGLYKKNEQRKEFDKLISYHKTMRDVVCQAWGLAYDTEQCLMWVHCTDAQDPNSAEFLDQAARDNWRRFIQQLRSIAGGQATAEEMTANFVLTYLDTQRQTMCRIRDDVTQLYQGVMSHYQRR
ncbi:uncharacterized protein A1O5_02850 [Cladophialophora psammophila CBS 110553]|uniref:Uncharacterized protein n=1 Tax=Cladophialophora psammophila CBS 110553 TaxID=1182543 RepID=W9XWB9_9EURO|nr:uncharacterized protein A1O5_02850 [Cladophialophora psammophila CBS 110553]EXJ74554.1 hypothetical protein A1O5_02850 [Cladophialophora psammophila CBS 110553]